MKPRANPEAAKPVIATADGYLMLPNVCSWKGVNGRPHGIRPIRPRCTGSSSGRGSYRQAFGGNGEWHAMPEAAAPHESSALRLDSTRAREILGWTPVLTLERAISLTVAWYRSVMEGGDAFDITCAQIDRFERLAATCQTGDK